MLSVKPLNAFRVHEGIIGFCDALAKDIGALTDFALLKMEDLSLYELLVNGPFHQDHYNLQGFGIDPVAARKNTEAATLFLEEMAREACDTYISSKSS